MAEDDSGWLTIEDLSFRSGVTTRNIRAYQSRGLLAPPVSRPGERSAFYTPEHLARLRLVSRLQERGFSLAGIADLLRAWVDGQSIAQVLGIESAADESTRADSRVMSDEALRAAIPPQVDYEQTVKRLLAIGLLDRFESGYRLRNSRVFELGIEAVRAGIPQDALLDEFVRLRADLHEVALRFVALFAQHVLQPFLQAGAPKERMAGIVEEMKRLRQLAVEATGGLIRQAIADEIDVAARASLPPEAESD